MAEQSKRKKKRPAAGGSSKPVKPARPRATAAAAPAATTTATTTHPSSAQSGSKVRVRMYRQGLGDCFLITFGVGSADERHMLIDCGSLGSVTTQVKLADVVDHIAKTTNGRLHLLVATHEHWDHVSGFGGNMEKFNTDPSKPKAGLITVERVWMAWTENPQDPLAQQITKSKEDLAAALGAALGATPADDQGAKQTAAAVKSLLGFVTGAQDDQPLGAAGDVSKKLNAAMNFVRQKLGVAPSFLAPGDMPETKDWLAGFRFYVLGPPRSREALSDLGEHGSSQLYSLVNGLRAAALIRTPPAAGEASVPIPEDCDDEFPFDPRFRSVGERQAKPWYPSYFADENDWRSIRHDWFGVTSDLALQLDSMTNNTSLAMAIERISDGKVLLFPGDAQQGNWLSWHDEKLAWKVKGSDGAEREVRAKDLLGATVFYKVGHHSSHNATASKQGLEMMTRNALTAFIPVDRAVALKRSPPNSWQMPARPLYRRLLDKCGGRVVRSDVGWAQDAGVKKLEDEQEFLGMAQPADWTNWSAAQQAATDAGTIDIQDVYIDYILA